MPDSRTPSQFARVRDRKDQPLATPNYSYEKRQRELAKKRKKEEKLKRKTEQPRGDAPQSGGGPEGSAGDAPQERPPSGEA
jgi:hypothetical protein